jgi:diguanylate cyclase (GGDEF)-like protein
LCQRGNLIEGFDVSMLDFLERFRHLPRFLIFAISLGLVGLIGLLDAWVVIDLGFSLFYLVPIALVTWLVGRDAGTVIATIAALVWFGAELRSYSSSGFPTTLWNTFVRLGIFWIIVTLLSSLRDAYALESRLARTDALTGITNWRSFQEILTAEIQRAQRYPYPITLAYLDIDNFKQVNDQQGHHQGDRLLKGVAQRLSSGIRNIDVVARIGGDEFIVMMPYTDRSQAEQVLPRVHQTLLDLVHKHQFPVGFSVGVVTFENPSTTVDDMVSVADSVMYQAKQNGKNQIVYQVL